MSNHSISLRIQLILYFLISISCYSQNDKIVLINKNNSWERTTIAYWTPSSTIATTYHEMWTNHQISRDKYVIEIPTMDPLFFTFGWSFKIQIVCLFPGDTLEFQSTTNESIPFQFSGSRPYNELMFYSFLETTKLGVLSGLQELEITNRLNFQYVADQTLERYKARLKALEDQSAGGKFSEQGRSVITQSLYYQYLGELLFPYQAWKPIEEIGKSAGNVSDLYKANLMNLENEFNKDSLMYVLHYRRFILQYARFLMFERSGVEKIDLASLLNFYKQTFSGKKRDLLLFDEIVFNYQVSGDASLIGEVIDSIKNQAMRDTLISIQKKSKKEFSKQALEAELETHAGEKHSLKEILSKYSDKLIYVDFWATWCGPCLMEMPDSRKLTEEFKHYKVEFVYLSIDKDRSKWLKKIPTLPGGSNVHHYRLVDDETFFKEMGIPSVPRYILIGKDGRMISFNAPRPRSKEVRKLISDNLR